MDTEISLAVNSKFERLTVDTRMLLVEALRDRLKLTGTHVSCDSSQCGACLVMVGGQPVKACTMFAVQADGAEITTVEGFARDDEALHPIQRAFREHHALQCGFCTPGMLVAGLDIIRRHGPIPDEDVIRRELAANFCRCTGYLNIVKAIRAAGAEMAEAGA